MPRNPEHPLHTTLCGWGEWMRAGGHDNQGWPGISVQAPERNEGGDVPAPGPRTPRLNPAPPIQWRRITVIMRRLHRDPHCRKPMEAIAEYYVHRTGGWNGHHTRGCDLIMGGLVAWID